MIVEAELISAICEVLERLGFNNFSVLLNHREILRGVLEVCGIEENKQTDALVALDKKDKIGKDGVIKELQEKGFSDESINYFDEFIDLLEKATSVIGEVYDGSNDAVVNRIRRKESLNTASLKKLKEFLGNNESGNVGVDALEKILNLSETTKSLGRIDVFPNLARGLSYYTGAIFEVGLDAEDFTLSIGGGGRYDGLIGMFGKEQIPACGFSLGLERILVVMEERGMFDELVKEGKLSIDSADVMIACFDENLVGESLKLAAELREKDFRVLVYPEASQKAKPMKYAEQIKVPFVCLLKENENSEIQFSLKNMQTGEQEVLEKESIAEKILSKIR